MIIINALSQKGLAISTLLSVRFGLFITCALTNLQRVCQPISINVNISFWLWDNGMAVDGFLCLITCHDTPSSTPFMI